MAEAEVVKKQEETLLGEVVGGRYEIQQLLGKGGMGKVFKVRHIELEKTFAMKTLHRDLTHDPRTIERFKREARAASRIGCQHIIEITDFAFDEKVGHFFIMEFLEGMDLHRRLKKYGPMHYSQVCHVLLQVCDALAAVHKQGIIHRDLKPDNVVLVDRDRMVDMAKILDFGIAAMQNQTEETGERLTQAGMIFGTPAYMSPEQAWGTEKLDGRTDLYALGCIGYEMLTGFVPFKGDHPFQIIDMHINVPPTPPSSVRPEMQIPPAVDAIILKCMAKRREDRFQTAEELQQAVLSVYQPGVTPVVDHRTGDRHVSSEQYATASASGLLARPRLQVDGLAVSSATSLRSPSRKWTYMLVGGGTLLALVIAAIVVLLVLPPKNGAGAKPAPGAGAAAPVAVDPAKAEAEKKRLEQELAKKLEQKLAKKLEQQMQAKAATVNVNFSSDPAGASVYRGEQFLGYTPMAFEFERSTTGVTFRFTKDGHKPAEQTTLLDKDGIVVAAKLEPEGAEKPAGGSVKAGGGTPKAGGGTPKAGGGKPREGGTAPGSGGKKPTFSDDFN